MQTLQFTLIDNELVYAALDCYWPACRLAAVSDDRVSGEFEFQQQLSIYDEDLDINIHLCPDGNCISRTK